MTGPTVSFRVFYYAAALGIAALVIVLLVEGQSLLVPFAVAVLGWFLVDAIADLFNDIKIGGRHVPRWLSVSTAMILVLAAAAFVINMAAGNFAGVTQAGPIYQQNLEHRLEEVSALLGVGELVSVDMLVSQIEIGPLIGSLAGALANFAANAGLVLIYMLFLFLEETMVGSKVARLFPDTGRRERVSNIMAQISRDVRKYLGIKTVMSLITGGLSYMVLISVGVDYAAFWGVVIFLLNYIPTIGSLLGIIFPSLLTLVQFDNFTPFLIVTPILATIQVVIGNVIEPRLMGGSLNLSPLVVLLSLAVWGSIWGVAGMFLSVPIMVILMIIFANFDQTRSVAILLSADGDISGFRSASRS